MTSSSDAAADTKKMTDDRGGLKFGADADYGSDSEYVSALPTDEEEQRILAGEDVRAREQIEHMDEGRASNHPSTLASMNKASSAAREVSPFRRWSFSVDDPCFSQSSISH